MPIERFIDEQHKNYIYKYCIVSKFGNTNGVGNSVVNVGNSKFVKIKYTEYLEHINIIFKCAIFVEIGIFVYLEH